MAELRGKEAWAGKEIWRGGVTPWQCDEMGHMNVRFYLSIASEGLAGLAAMLGMPRAFTAGASSTLLVREHHVRFLKEARPGAGLVMTGGLLDIGETEASLVQLLYHVTGEPAAAVTAKVEHVTPRDLRPFPWTRATRDRVEAMRIEAPEFARPRSIATDPRGCCAGCLKARPPMWTSRPRCGWVNIVAARKAWHRGC